MSSSLPQPAAVNAGAVAEDPDNQTLPAAVNAGTVAEDPDNQTLPAATASEKPAQVVSEISEHASVEGSPDQLELGTDGASGSQKVGGTGTTANARPLDRWNQTATHAFRFVSTLFCFVVMGINDACFGVSLRFPVVRLEVLGRIHEPRPAHLDAG